MTRKTFILSLTALSLAASSFALPAAAKQDETTREQRGERMIKRLDTDKDGKVSLDEAEAIATKAFAAFDADKNGEVTREEIEARRKAFRAARMELRKTEKGSERQEARAKLDELRPAALPGMRPRLFRQADVDKNGSLSLAEVSAVVGQRFKTRDTNGDGFIDAADLTRKI